MGSNWLVRLMLWLVTLLSPAFLMVVYNSGVTVFAPLWLLGLYESHTFLMILGFPPPLFQSFIIYLIAPILLTSPVLLTTGLLEVVSRHRDWLRYARIMIVIYPVLVLFANVLLLMLYSDMLAVPVPLAALVQYVRYRQLSLVLGAPAPMTTERSPAV